MTANNTTAAAPRSVQNFQHQFDDFAIATSVWLQTHWLQVIIAAVIGVVIAAALYAVRRLGTRLCRPSEKVLDILPAPQQGAFSKEDGEVVVDAQGRRVGE